VKEMLQLAWFGTRLICPVCRKGHMSRSLFSLEEACPHCSTVFEPEEGDFVGAMLVSYCFTAVLVAIGIAVVVALTDWDIMVHVWTWSIVTALFIPLTYRNFKGMWVGILHAMSPLPKRSETEQEH
jgi:uncharacterized protein (DUF983 family)